MTSLDASGDASVLYRVIYTAPFEDAWQKAQERGYLDSIRDAQGLLALRRRLEENPYFVPAQRGLPSDLRVFPVNRNVDLWYSIVEDDRIVYMEAVITSGDAG